MTLLSKTLAQWGNPHNKCPFLKIRTGRKEEEEEEEEEEQVWKWARPRSQRDQG